ncbi:MAG: ABC transporter ATP-binding protein [Deltaproteobacteria bacterium]|uniref:ABC transporter ATP-binding protein n=1 Tax=Candidatus Zymogenus saltonus TaxID=2844893 RepID=A0A9D8PR19_9DELT|nr:ABC transporter ATP-binding protein [Candidatus Zymogenus saltonus]
MIEIKGLCKDYGRIRAVNNLNLAVGRGEFFGFLGPNGAGKTTTIKIMAGLLRPTSGEVGLGGHDLEKEMFEAKGITSYIPDKPFLYEKLTGREFLRFVSGLYRVKDDNVAEKTEELIETFSMAEWIDDMVEGYSHGMKQKLVMAQALIHDPKIIIVDEPMVGLDPRSIKLVKEIFSGLSKNGVTIFMSTHTLGHAQEMCDRIGIIHRGKLVALGTIDELMRTAHTKGRELEEIFFILTEEESDSGATE